MTNPDPNTCPSGTLFYTCAQNNFRGCCPFDPCSKEGCEDNDTQASTLSSTSSTTRSVPPPSRTSTAAISRTAATITTTATAASVPSATLSPSTIALICVGAAIVVLLCAAAAYKVRQIHRSRAQRDTSTPPPLPCLNGTSVPELWATKAD